jgi:hypothetical protein
MELEILGDAYNLLEALLQHPNPNIAAAAAKELRAYHLHPSEVRSTMATVADEQAPSTERLRAIAELGTMMRSTGA